MPRGLAPRIIYFGTQNNPALVSTASTDTVYNPGVLLHDMTYYWKITAYDMYGDSTVGSVWSFVTNTFTCGDILIDERDGQVYTTVQIGSQCWMAENLNIGTRINGIDDMTDNGVIEKFCYDDLESNCDVNGGFYQWDEMMDYVSIGGTQGLCPPNGGWHIPTDAEWFALENYLDPSINNPSLKGWRGTDCGTQLKQNGSSGFNALMTGWRYHDGSFLYLSTKTIFWTSSYSGLGGWFRILDISNPKSNRNETYTSHGNSVRCLKD